VFVEGEVKAVATIAHNEGGLATLEELDGVIPGDWVIVRELSLVQSESNGLRAG
jgi:hypothetical protein